MEPEISMISLESAETRQAETKQLDFTYGRSLTTSYCMRCGGTAPYYGKSNSLNFNKKLCGDCVMYYSNTLNG